MTRFPSLSLTYASLIFHSFGISQSNTFVADGNFVPVNSGNVDILLVGGGGAGGGNAAQSAAGGIGGGGTGTAGGQNTGGGAGTGGTLNAGGSGIIVIRYDVNQ